MIKLIQQIYGIYLNPHTGFYWWTPNNLNFNFICLTSQELEFAKFKSFKFRKCSTSLGVKELKELSLRLGVKPLPCKWDSLQPEYRLNYLTTSEPLARRSQTWVNHLSFSMVKVNRLISFTSLFSLLASPKLLVLDSKNEKKVSFILFCAHLIVRWALL